MNKKVYMLIQLNEKKGDRVICVSEDMMVCIRRVKTLELGNVGKFDITYRPGLINISNVIKHVHYQIISRDILYTSDTIDELFYPGLKISTVLNWNVFTMYSNQWRKQKVLLILSQIIHHVSLKELVNGHT